MLFSEDLIALSKLLDASHVNQPPAEDVGDDDKVPAGFTSPASIAVSKESKCNTADTEPMIAVPKGKAAAAKANKDIWDEEEVPDQEEACVADDDVDDDRECPRYDILYKQAVTPEDMFLGMTGKDPGTHSCEDLLVKVWLPGTAFQTVNLNTTSTVMLVTSPKYKLKLQLPYPVEHKKGSAKWDSSKFLLSVTLPRDREQDLFHVP